MQIGMVGLGRMGGNMARRLMRGGHEAVAYATDPSAVKQISSEGATGVSTLDDLVARLAQPRTAWIMVPAGEATEQVVMELAKRMSRGDVIIDGGNSFYKDDVRRKKMLEPQGIHYIEAGTSGGVWGWGVLALPARARAENPPLPSCEGGVAAGGGGGGRVMQAVEGGVPADVLSASLYTRFRSRQEHTFAERVLSAMRHKFGGHV